MLKRYDDCKGRCACYADPSTGLIEHDYKRVKTKTIIPVGGVYVIERDQTETILQRVSDRYIKVTSNMV